MCTPLKLDLRVLHEPIVLRTLRHVNKQITPIDHVRPHIPSACSHWDVQLYTSITFLYMSATRHLTIEQFSFQIARATQQPSALLIVRVHDLFERNRGSHSVNLAQIKILEMASGGFQRSHRLSHLNHLDIGSKALSHAIWLNRWSLKPETAANSPCRLPF